MLLDTSDPAKRWRPLPPFPGAKRWLFSTETDGKFIWVFGGIYQAEQKDPTTQLDEVQRYNIAAGTWESMPSYGKASRCRVHR